MNSFWNKQIERADTLAQRASGSKELLYFYEQLLRSQKQIYGYFLGQKKSFPLGNLKSDLPTIRSAFATLVETVVLHGPESLSGEGQALRNADSSVIDRMVIDYWQNPSDIDFFPKATLQPYLRFLIDAGVTPIGRELAGGERSCPYCGGRPQVSFLQSKESGAESGNRDLLCASCLSSWEFRRVVCANCGEERPTKLGYFHSPEFEHVRIEACDSCLSYIKGVDLTILGHAAPLVDEIYAAPLDLWAREHGYSKIELNLVGV